MLRVCGRGAIPKSQEPPAGQKPPGHLVAGFGQSRSFSPKESLEDQVAPEQFLATTIKKKVCVY
jgi:hypothetical protein